MAAPPVLRIASSFGAWPTWDDATGESVDPADLPIPTALIERIQAWDGAFQAIFDDAYPPDSRFPDDAAEAAWRAEGNAIFQALSDLLGPDRVRRREPL